MDQKTRKLMTMYKPYIPEITLTEYISQLKKEEEDLPALKTVLRHRYNDLKTT